MKIERLVEEIAHKITQEVGGNLQEHEDTADDLCTQMEDFARELSASFIAEAVAEELTDEIRNLIIEEWEQDKPHPYILTKQEIQNRDDLQNKFFTGFALHPEGEGKNPGIFFIINNNVYQFAQNTPVIEEEFEILTGPRPMLLLMQDFAQKGGDVEEFIKDHLEIERLGTIKEEDLIGTERAKNSVFAGNAINIRGEKTPGIYLITHNGVYNGETGEPVHEKEFEIITPRIKMAHLLTRFLNNGGFKPE